MPVVKLRKGAMDAFLAGPDAGGRTSRSTCYRDAPSKNRDQSPAWHPMAPLPACPAVFELNG